MKTTITVLQMLIRVTGLIQIVLGVTFWIGYARNLVTIHMLIGLVLVLSLWILAILVTRTGVSWGFVALAIVWGLIVVALGVTQTQLLPGAFHWVIQIVHLLLGLSAIGLSERLVRMSEQRQTAALAA